MSGLSPAVLPVNHSFNTSYMTADNSFQDYGPSRKDCIQNFSSLHPPAELEVRRVNDDISELGDNDSVSVFRNDYRVRKRNQGGQLPPPAPPKRGQSKVEGGSSLQEKLQQLEKTVAAMRRESNKESGGRVEQAPLLRVQQQNDMATAHGNRGSTDHLLRKNFKATNRISQDEFPPVGEPKETLKVLGVSLVASSSETPPRSKTTELHQTRNSSPKEIFVAKIVTPSDNVVLFSKDQHGPIIQELTVRNGRVYPVGHHMSSVTPSPLPQSSATTEALNEVASTELAVNSNNTEDDTITPTALDFGTALITPVNNTVTKNHKEGGEDRKLSILLDKKLDQITATREISENKSGKNEVPATNSIAGAHVLLKSSTLSGADSFVHIPAPAIIDYSPNEEIDRSMGKEQELSTVADGVVNVSLYSKNELESESDRDGNFTSNNSCKSDEQSDGDQHRYLFTQSVVQSLSSKVIANRNSNFSSPDDLPPGIVKNFLSAVNEKRFQNLERISTVVAVEKVDGETSGKRSLDEAGVMKDASRVRMTVVL